MIPKYLASWSHGIKRTLRLWTLHPHETVNCLYYYVSLSSFFYYLPPYTMWLLLRCVLSRISKDTEPTGCVSIPLSLSRETNGRELAHMTAEATSLKCAGRLPGWRPRCRLLVPECEDHGQSLSPCTWLCSKWWCASLSRSVLCSSGLSGTALLSSCRAVRVEDGTAEVRGGSRYLKGGRISLWQRRCSVREGSGDLSSFANSEMPMTFQWNL